MLESGAEIFRTEDSLYRICESYGFLSSDVHVISTNIQATIETPEGEIITQIHHIRKTGFDFTRLHLLNHLCRRICETHPDESTLKQMRIQIQNMPPQNQIVVTLAAMLGGGGFAGFFGGNVFDTLIACLISAFIALGGLYLKKKEDNVFIYNLILAGVSEILILLIASFYPDAHSDSITIGMVMVLISALSTTNGIRDMFQRNIISGIQNILGSILGAAGIASGIAIGMSMFSQRSSDIVIAPNYVVQLISVTIACIGFAIWFHVPGVAIAYIGAGGFCTWLIYALLYYKFEMRSFLATFFGACFVAAFAYVMSRVNKMPSTIFLATAVIPLLPAKNLYYMMYAVTMSDSALLRVETVALLKTCLGIALGFLVFDALMRYTMSMRQRIHL